MAEEEKKEQEAPKKVKGSKKLIIIVAAAVVVLGGGGAAAFLLLGGDHAEAAAHGEAAQEEKPVQITPVEMGPLKELDSFIVNLADVDSNRYLKLTAHLELGSELVAEHVDARNPQIRDAVITLLASKTTNDVVDVKGKVKLRREIIMRLNDILGEGAVSQVYFTEFIVQ